MKNNRGITLTSLVVTIIVLLILAGVSLTFVLGNNGIVQKAQDAKTDTDIATAREKLDMELSTYDSLKFIEGKTPNLKEYLNEKGIEAEENYSVQGAFYVITIDDRKFVITPDKKIADENTIQLSAKRITFNDFFALKNNGIPYAYIYQLYAYSPLTDLFEWKIENSPEDPFDPSKDYMFADQTSNNMINIEVLRDKFKYGEIKITASIPGTDISATCIVDTDIGGVNGPT